MIIDDAGYSLDELQEFLDLPGPLTIAVLPNLPHSREAAARVLAAGKDLILHCPMQPVGRENPGPGALYVGQSADRVAALLDAAFASVPGAIGMNNHMGSAATADPALMTDVLEYLKEKNLFYIDSRTTADTVGPRIARELGVPFTQRDVFIDDDPVETKVGVAFDAGIVAARSTGSVVMIGHIQNRSVAAILRSRNAALEGLGLKWASLRDVMRDRERKDLPVEDTRDRKLLR
ncbi:MAG TPA: divergent polysaccharide deacetylase family protein [Spirochaetia bacterium]